VRINFGCQQLTDHVVLINKFGRVENRFQLEDNVGMLVFFEESFERGQIVMHVDIIRVEVDADQ